MAGLLSGLLDAGLLGGPEAGRRLAGARPAAVAPAVARALATSAVTVGRAGPYAPTREEVEPPLGA
jgi:fructokinase